MICKKCPYCGRKSYSAAVGEEWYCPYCGRDLRSVQYYTAPVSGLPAAERTLKDAKIPNTSKII